MRIAALDTAVTDFDGLSWDPFSELGEFTAYERTTPSELLPRAAGCEAIITNKVVIDKEAIAALSNLRYIGVFATGYNCVDLAAATDAGIIVTNVPAYGTDSVAQFVIAFLLSHYTPIAEYHHAVRQGAWEHSPDFCFFHEPLRELRGKTLGIVGFGEIGTRVSALAEQFGMIVLCAALPGRSYRTPRPSLREVFARSDIVSLHCPLTELTHHLINEQSIGWLKPGALLINTARGGLLDEHAVAHALHSGHLGHLCADVLSREPPEPSNPLLRAPRTTLTPHVAWGTREARTRLLHEAARNLRAFLDGTPRNVVHAGALR